VLFWVAVPETGERKSAIGVRIKEHGKIALGATAERRYVVD